MLNTLSAHGLKMAVLRQSALGLCLWVIPRGERRGTAVELCTLVGLTIPPDLRGGFLFCS